MNSNINITQAIRDEVLSGKIRGQDFCVQMAVEHGIYCDLNRIYRVKKDDENKHQVADLQARIAELEKEVS